MNDRFQRDRSIEPLLTADYYTYQPGGPSNISRNPLEARLADRDPKGGRPAAAQVSPFDETYGLELGVCNAQVVEAVAPVRPSMLQVSGLVHGGVFAAMAETLASLGTNAGVRTSGQIALGASNHTSFLRPISEGSIRARAHRVHAGKTTWLWDVEFFDGAGQLCSVSRMTVAVRPQDAGSPRPSR